MGQDSYLPLEKSGQSVIEQNLPYRFLRGQPLNSQPKKNNTCGQVTPRRVPLTPVDTATPSTSSLSANGLKQIKILQRAKILPVVFPKSQHRLQVILEQKTKPFSVKPHLAVHRGG